MRNCLEQFQELIENDDQIPLVQLQDNIHEVENDFYENLRITLFDNQANLEYDFFNEYEEFQDDNKDAEDLFLAVEDIDDHSSDY